MPHIRTTAHTPVQAPPAANTQPQKAESAVARHLNEVKSAVFGKTGSAILAGAASGALVGGLAGAAAGGLVGLSMASFAQGNSSASILSASVGVGLAAVAFPPAGALLVGASALAFATGTAQEAAGKLGDFLSKHGPEPQAAPAK